jgi:hypothetical protein
MSSLSAALITAYRAAEYTVHDGDATLRLRIDRRDAALARLLERHQATCAAIVTACNPEGEKLTDVENAERHRTLLARLARAGLAWLPARGDDPDGDYPGEISVLIMGIARENALALGREFVQNAIVWIDADAVPHLELLR